MATKSTPHERDPLREAWRLTARPSLVFPVFYAVIWAVLSLPLLSLLVWDQLGALGANLSEAIDVLTPAWFILTSVGLVMTPFCLVAAYLTRQPSQQQRTNLDHCLRLVLPNLVLAGLWLINLLLLLGAARGVAA